MTTPPLQKETASLRGLVERLEAASEGSRELNGAIWRIFEPAEFADKCSFRGSLYAGHRHSKAEKRAHEDRMGAFLAPAYTTSLDAALALAERVLPEWAFEMTGYFGLGGARVETAPDRWAPYDNADAETGGVVVNAKTPALALCIAILRARSTAEGAVRPTASSQVSGEA